MERAIFAADNETGVFEPLQGLARDARVEPGAATYLPHIGCAEYQGREDLPPGVVGEQADQFPGGERRRGHTR